MALREIVIYPDPRLRETSQPVEAVDEEVRKLVTDMQEIKHYYALQGVQARKGIEY